MVLQEPACGSKTLLQDMQEAYEKGLVSRGGDHRSGGAPDGSSYSSGYDEGLSVPV